MKVFTEIRISVETSHQLSHICSYFLHHTICSACRTNQLFDRFIHFIHRKPFHLVPNPPHFWSGLHCCLPSACELAFEAFHYFYQMLSALLWLFPVFCSLETPTDDLVWWIRITFNQPEQVVFRLVLYGSWSVTLVSARLSVTLTLVSASSSHTGSRGGCL